MEHLEFIDSSNSHPGVWKFRTVTLMDKPDQPRKPDTDMGKRGGLRASRRPGLAKKFLKPLLSDTENQISKELAKF